jgi:hypothetical protein
MHVILSFILSAMPWGIAQQSYLELSRRISKSGRGEKSDSEGVISSRRWLTERSENDRLDMAYPIGLEKCELTTIQLTRVMYAVGEKMGAEEWERGRS